jgi:2,3-bisphosphoglycerate-dependent phosphoglycerate mutase
LTPRGHAQANCVAEFLRDELGKRLPLLGMGNEAARPCIVYSSLMTRAVETGRAIARAVDAPLVALAEAYEVGGLYLDHEESGEKRGMAGPNRAHYQMHYPELGLPEELGEEGWYNRPHEPKPERAARAQRVRDLLFARHGRSDDIVALVTHGGFYNHLLAVLLELPAKDKFWFTLNNCAVSRLDETEYGLALVYLNRFDFLPPDLLTL